MPPSRFGRDAVPSWLLPARSLMLLFVLLLAVVTNTHAANNGAVELRAGQDQYDLSLDLTYLEDPGNSMTLEQVRQKQAEQAFLGGQSRALNFGFTNSAYWFYVRLKNLDSPHQQWILQALYSMTDYVDVYFVHGSGEISHQASGDSVPFHQRAKAHHSINFSAQVAPGEYVDLFIRAQSTGAVQMPLELSSRDAFEHNDHLSRLFLGFYYGLIAAMALYNLFIFFAIRDVNYLLYVVYILSYGLFQLSLNGLAFEHLWPDNPWWNNRSLAFITGFAMITVLAFSRSFLALKTNLPRADKFFTWLIVYFFMTTVLSLLAPYNYVIRAVTVVTLLSVTSIFVVGLLCWRQRYKPARYFMISWTALLAGMLLYGLQTLGIIPTNLLTRHAIQIGSAFEVIMLSLALADRLRIATQQHQNLQRQQKMELERRVQERTAELEEANRKLSELSLTDGLTGVANRRSFDAAIQRECKRANREISPVSLLLIDIDYFKHLNDRYGHQAGDECLVRIAGLLKVNVHRPADAVARYGGEEFAVILPSTKPEGAIQVAEAIRAAVERTMFRIQDEQVKLSVSIGIATTLPSDNGNPGLLIQRADQALYQSKASGRNQCSFCDDEA